MKGLNLSLALAAAFLVCPVALYSQVEEPGRGINSPFATYEDANLMDPGTFSIGQYGSFLRTAGGDSFSAPGVDFGLGLHRRLELSGFGAVAFSRDEADRLSPQPDDSYLGLKLLLASEGRFRPALAVKPTLELLGSTSGDRAHFVLPVILQKDVRLCDLAGTAGYVTRGVAFSSLKCEWSIRDRITPMAVVQASRVTKDLQLISDLGLNRTEVYGSAGVDIELSPHWSVFLEMGRVLGRTDENSAHLSFTASISFTGRLWGKSDRRHRQRVPAFH
jgi:hypothetical protein